MQGMVYGDEACGWLPRPFAKQPRILVKIHHNNLLNNILTKIEASVMSVDDALMLDGEGFIAGTRDQCVCCPQRHPRPRLRWPACRIDAAIIQQLACAAIPWKNAA